MPSTWGRLIRLVVPYWRGMLLATLLAVVTIGTSIGLMTTSAWLISKSAIALSIADLGVAAVSVRFFGVSRAVFRYLERYVSHGVTFRLLAWIRVWFYERIEPLAPARLSQYRSGDLLGRVVADVDTLQDVFLRALAPPFVAVLVSIFMTLFMFSFDPALAFTLVVFFITAGIGLPVLAWQMGRGPGQKLIQARADLNAALLDGVQGLADAAAYNHTAALSAEVDRLNESLRREGKAMAWLDGLQMALGLGLTQLAALTVLIVAIPRVEGIFLATLTLGTIAAFEAITPLAATAAHISQQTRAAERLFEIVDSPPPIVEPETAPPHVPAAPTLQVRDLRFRYSHNEPYALDGLSFTLEPGKVLAVVGPSGAGKSTLVNLLLRFYDYDEGTITLGGQPLKAFPSDAVHAQVGVVSQRTHLFNTTIRENLRIAREGSTMEDVEAAARRAQIHDFIAGLPDGYATFVGEAGAALSGGERQRLAIARALLKDAPLLVLDEATANLDAVTERAFLETLFSALDAREDRALLMITHRLTLLDRADEIIVLDGGREVERGTQAALLAQDGLYKRLWSLQNQVLAETI